MNLRHQWTIFIQSPFIRVHPVQRVLFQLVVNVAQLILCLLIALYGIEYLQGCLESIAPKVYFNVSTHFDFEF